MSTALPSAIEGVGGLAGSAPLFAAVGDAPRLRLVARLSAGGPQSISRLTAGTRVSRQAVTKHLQVLADAGLARSARQGRESIWELDPGRLQEARRCLDRISAQWGAARGGVAGCVEG